MEPTFADVPAHSPLMASQIKPLIRTLRPALSAADCSRFVAEASAQGLVFTAARDGAGRCLGVAAHRTLATSRGRVLFVDDLVTAPEARSTGVGARLLAELAERGRAQGCVRIELDSGVQNHGAHRFYHARRMAVSAFHFSLDLGPEPGLEPDRSPDLDRSADPT